MSKVLLFSHNGFSDQNANGMTMKAFLSAWNPEEKAQFYYGNEKPDYSASQRNFKVTDMEMLKSFLGKKPICVYNSKEAETEKNREESPSKKGAEIPGSLKKNKYNFFLRWAREILRMVSPFWKKKFHSWVDEFSPDYIVYMVGEGIAMDKAVLETVERTKAKLVLYNGEAYRIIDLSGRKGIEKLYYKTSENLYEKLNKKASLVTYNCETLLEDYAKKYPVLCKQTVSYNTAFFDTNEYVPSEKMNIAYFGNMGVGRVPSLLDVAETMKKIDEKLVLDIYGRTSEENIAEMEKAGNIRYHGMVNQEVLTEVKNNADILLCVESFEKDIVKKLRYAFSTKIAQCLCAGRCVLVYAPKETASTQYFIKSGSAAVASNKDELEKVLGELIAFPEKRKFYAKAAKKTAKENHDSKAVSEKIRSDMESV